MSHSKRKPWTKEKHLDTSKYWRPVRRVTKQSLKTIPLEEDLLLFDVKSPKQIVTDWRYADRTKRPALIKKRYNFFWDFWYGIFEEDIEKLKRK